jgi:hypothetical protein
MLQKPFLFFLLLLFLTMACRKEEEECFECEVVKVIGTRVFDDRIIVYKERQEIGRCRPSKAARDKKEKEMKKRAEEQREYLRAYVDSTYDGFYTGKRSIDSRADLVSMLDKEGPAFPFLIRVVECEHFSRIDRD